MALSSDPLTSVAFRPNLQQRGADKVRGGDKLMLQHVARLSLGQGKPRGSSRVTWLLLAGLRGVKPETNLQTWQGVGKALATQVNLRASSPSGLPSSCRQRL